MIWLGAGYGALVVVIVVIFHRLSELHDRLNEQNYYLMEELPGHGEWVDVRRKLAEFDYRTWARVRAALGIDDDG